MVDVALADVTERHSPIPADLSSRLFADGEADRRPASLSSRSGSTRRAGLTLVGRRRLLADRTGADDRRAARLRRNARSCICFGFNIASSRWNSPACRTLRRSQPSPTAPRAVSSSARGLLHLRGARPDAPGNHDRAGRRALRAGSPRRIVLPQPLSHRCGTTEAMASWGTQGATIFRRLHGGTRMNIPIRFRYSGEPERRPRLGSSKGLRPPSGCASSSLRLQLAASCDLTIADVAAGADAVRRAGDGSDREP